MMSYETFLLFITQMDSQRKAKVVIQGSVIFIESSQKKDNWNLSTKILRRENKNFPSFARDCISYTGLLKCQGRGAYLKLDSETNSIYLVQEIISSKKYLPFKYLIQDFASVAHEWKEILEEFSARDDSILRLG